ncbi:MAG: helix-turn-helix domain-containing protein [Actinocatenispora sp.]
MGSPMPQEINDLETLKALAHPRRQRIIEYLAAHGPVTSASLARELGLNTGATSYHLRELARHGFVEEVPDQARGRERWWRAVRGDRRFPPHSRQSPKIRAAVDQMNRLSVEGDIEQFHRFQAQRDRLGEWADAVSYSRSTLHLTVEQVQGFLEDYIELVNRYKGEQAPSGTRPVLVRFVAFPAPDPDDTPRPDEPSAGTPDAQH